MKYISGFTLIELMVTIAVMAIIATIAAPSMAQFLNNSRVNSESRNFTMALSEARSNAVLTNKPTTLHIGKEDPLTSADGTAVTDFYWSPSDKATMTADIKEVTYLPSGIIKGATSDLVFKLCVGESGSNIKFSNQGGLKLITQGNCP